MADHVRQGTGQDQSDLFRGSGSDLVVPKDARTTRGTRRSDACKHVIDGEFSER